VAVPDVALPLDPAVPEPELVAPLAPPVVDEPLAPMPEVLVLLPGVVVVDAVPLGVVTVVLSRPDVRVVDVDVQLAAKAVTTAIARMESERCVMDLPASRTMRKSMMGSRIDGTL
jgi:hypothetical protein